jgi:hypothetical protein
MNHDNEDMDVVDAAPANKRAKIPKEVRDKPNLYFKAKSLENNTKKSKGKINKFD